MKKNKIVVLAGMALLMVGTILNVHDALNEIGRASWSNGDITASAGDGADGDDIRNYN